MNFDAALTRLLKTIAVIGVVLLAGLIVIVEVAVLKKQEPVTWHWHAGAVLLVSFCFCAAYLLVRPPLDPLAGVYCERFHTLGGHTVVTSYRGSVSPFAHHLGGFLFSIFYSASRKQKFRCRECGTTFEAHTTTSRAYRVLYLLMLAVVLNFMWSEIAEFWSG